MKWMVFIHVINSFNKVTDTNGNTKGRGKKLDMHNMFPLRNVKIINPKLYTISKTSGN